MNTDISDSIRIIRTINHHLDEAHCNHNIKAIMAEAFEDKNAGLPAQQENPIPEPEAATTQSNLNGNATR